MVKKRASRSWVDLGGYHPMAKCDFGDGFTGFIDWFCNDGYFEWYIVEGSNPVDLVHNEICPEICECGFSDSVNEAMHECSDAWKYDMLR